MYFEANIYIRGILDMLTNELQNPVFHKLSSEPTGTVDGITVPVTAMFFYNTATNKFGYYNGSAWYYPGNGDMLKSTYDTNANGNCDTADNALLLGGQDLAYVLSLANATGTLNLSALPSHASTHKLGGADQIRLNELGIPTGTVNMNGYRIVSAGDATADTDLATLGQLKQYVTGARYKTESVRCVATSNITLSGFQTIDGQVLASGDANLRVLVSAQTTSSQNGIYIASSSTWARATDADTWDELVSAVVVVEQGTTYKDTQWMCTIDRGGTMGTTSITWLNLPTVNDIIAGNGLTKTGNTLSANVDSQSLEIASDIIQAKLYTGGAITKSASGLAVNTDGQSTEIASNAVQVKLWSSGGIVKGASGIYISTGTGIVLSSNSLTIDAAYRTKSIRLQFTADGSSTSWDITGLAANGIESVSAGGARHITVMRKTGTAADTSYWSEVICEKQMRHSATAPVYRIIMAKAPASGVVFEVIVSRSWA